MGSFFHGCGDMCAASSEACRTNGSPTVSVRGFSCLNLDPAGQFVFFLGGGGGGSRSVCKAAREIEVYEVRTGELLQRQIINPR